MSLPYLINPNVPRPVYNRCNSFTLSIMHDPAAALVKLYLSGLKWQQIFFFFFFSVVEFLPNFFFSEIWLSVAIFGGEREGGGVASCVFLIKGRKQRLSF